MKEKDTIMCIENKTHEIKEQTKNWIRCRSESGVKSFDNWKTWSLWLNTALQGQKLNYTKCKKGEKKQQTQVVVLKSTRLKIVIIMPLRYKKIIDNTVEPH